jgi:phage-related protein
LSGIILLIFYCVAGLIERIVNTFTAIFTSFMNIIKAIISVLAEIIVRAFEIVGSIIKKKSEWFEDKANNFITSIQNYNVVN